VCWSMLLGRAVAKLNTLFALFALGKIVWVTFAIFEKLAVGIIFPGNAAPVVGSIGMQPRPAESSAVQRAVPRSGKGCPTFGPFKMVALLKSPFSMAGVGTMKFWTNPLTVRCPS